MHSNISPQPYWRSQTELYNNGSVFCHGQWWTSLNECSYSEYQDSGLDKLEALGERRPPWMRETNSLSVPSSFLFKSSDSADIDFICILSWSESMPFYGTNITLLVYVNSPGTHPHWFVQLRIVAVHTLSPCNVFSRFSHDSILTWLATVDLSCNKQKSINKQKSMAPLCIERWSSISQRNYLAFTSQNVNVLLILPEMYLVY